MLSFIAASVPSANVMDTLGRISKQLDNLESTFGLERGEYVYPPPGAEHCAKGVEIYCAKQGTVHTRKEKINLVERFCDEDFCREDADWQKCMGLQKRTAAQRVRLSPPFSPRVRQVYQLSE